MLCVKLEHPLAPSNAAPATPVPATFKKSLRDRPLPIDTPRRFYRTRTFHGDSSRQQRRLTDTIVTPHRTTSFPRPPEHEIKDHLNHGGGERAERQGVGDAVHDSVRLYNHQASDGDC